MIHLRNIDATALLSIIAVISIKQNSHLSSPSHFPQAPRQTLAISCKIDGRKDSAQPPAATTVEEMLQYHQPRFGCSSPQSMFHPQHPPLFRNKVTWHNFPASRLCRADTASLFSCCLSVFLSLLSFSRKFQPQ